MKKQIALRFRHKSLSSEVLKELEIDNTVITYKNHPDTFDIFFDVDEAVAGFPSFQCKVEAKTGERPFWTSAYRADIKDFLVLEPQYTAL
jgi:hypothetical protein